MRPDSWPELRRISPAAWSLPVAAKKVERPTPASSERVRLEAQQPAPVRSVWSPIAHNTRISESVIEGSLRARAGMMLRFGNGFQRFGVREEKGRPVWDYSWPAASRVSEQTQNGRSP